MTEVIHLTEQDAKELHAVLMRALKPSENVAVVNRLRNAMCRKFGLIWREEQKNFVKPV
jgi:predicted N-acetyltransferase YhbS